MWDLLTPAPIRIPLLLGSYKHVLAEIQTVYGITKLDSSLIRKIMTAGDIMINLKD